VSVDIFEVNNSACGMSRRCYNVNDGTEEVCTQGIRFTLTSVCYGDRWVVTSRPDGSRHHTNSTKQKRCIV